MIAESALAAVGGHLVSMETMREQVFEDVYDRPPESQAEHDAFVIEYRDEHSPAVFAQWTTNELEQIDHEYPVYIDAATHADEVLEFRNYFQNSYLVWVAASARERHHRTGESSTETDVRHYKQLGLKTVMDDCSADIIFDNTSDKHNAIDKARKMVSGEQ